VTKPTEAEIDGILREGLAELVQEARGLEPGQRRSRAWGRTVDLAIRARSALYPPKQALELTQGPAYDYANDRQYLEALKLEIDAKLALPAKKGDT
jgi:hypothetical protein